MNNNPHDPQDDFDLFSKRSADSEISGSQISDCLNQNSCLDNNPDHPSVPSNLVERTDGFLKMEDINDIDVILKKCSCRCVWCPVCWEYVYVPKLKAYLGQMDYRRVRHITPTIARDQFETLEEAYRLFKAGEFVHKITRGLKKRSGFEWTDQYIYPPIEWHSWLWWVEFHEDGTAHFHLALEVDKQGQEGMIGGDRLRYYWPYGRIHESYFETEKHWQRFIGYEVKKNYASKENYQGRLPELLDQEGEKKIRRWGRNRKKDKTEDEISDELGNYFDRKGMELKKAEMQELLKEPKKERNKKRSYSVIMAECGKKSFVNIIIRGILLQGILKVPYAEMKELIKGQYQEKKGYVGSITGEILSELVPKFEKIIRLSGTPWWRTAE